jgi:hypothetical protein
MLRKLVVLSIIILCFGATCLAEETPIDSNLTVLRLIDEQSIEQAKAKPTAYFSYYLGNKYPILLYPMNFYLMTPYVMLQYAYYQEKQAYIPVNESILNDIFAVKDYVFIFTNANSRNNITVILPSNLKNLVVKKGETVYQSVSVQSKTLINWGAPPNALYAFPIGIFDGQDLEIIAIDQKDQRFIIKVKGKDMGKVLQ